MNAIDGGMVEELDRTFRELAADDAVRGTVLTGDGPFFSFGFDVPALYDLDRADFTEFLRGFTSLYAALFVFPRPMVAAINGHAAASTSDRPSFSGDISPHPSPVTRVPPVAHV